MQSTAPEQMPATPTNTVECMTISERQFMWDHTKYSAISSWLFAIAGATNIGVLCAFSSKILSAAEQGKPLFRSSDPAVTPVLGNRTYNRIALGMMAFGGICMGVSNWLESKKVVTEWQLGAGKLQRKVNIAEERTPKASGELAFDSASSPTSSATDAPETPPLHKNWAASLQSNEHAALAI